MAYKPSPGDMFGIPGFGQYGYYHEQKGHKAPRTNTSSFKLSPEEIELDKRIAHDYNELVKQILYANPTASEERIRYSAQIELTNRREYNPYDIIRVINESNDIKRLDTLKEEIIREIRLSREMPAGGAGAPGHMPSAVNASATRNRPNNRNASVGALGHNHSAVIATRNRPNNRNATLRRRGTALNRRRTTTRSQMRITRSSHKTRK
jgi:hypothetical protein